MSRGILDYFETIFMRFGVKFVNFVFFLVIARYLTISELAVYGVIFTTSLLSAVLIDGGLRNLVLKVVGGEGAYDWGFYLKFHSIFIVYLVFFLVGVVGLYFYGLLGSLREYIYHYVLLSMAMAYVRSSQAFFLALGNIRIFNYSEAVVRIVLALSMLICMVWYVVDINTALIMLVVSQCVGAIYCIAYSSYSKSRCVVNISLSTNIVFSGLLFMICVLFMSFNKQMHFYALGYMGGRELSGYYFAIYRLAEILTEIALGISIVLVSRTAVASNSLKEFSIDSFSYMMRITYFLFFFPLCFACVFGGYFVNAWFSVNVEGDAFSVPLIFVGSYVGVFWVVAFPSMAVIFPVLRLLVGFLITILLTLIGYLFLYKYGGDIKVSDVGVLYLLSNTLVTGYFCFVLKEKYRVSWTDLFLVRTSDIRRLLGKGRSFE
jgi:O-antigen/teichoic acid export membrane protein